MNALEILADSGSRQWRKTSRKSTPAIQPTGRPAINEQLLAGADENCRNPSRVAKQQRYILKEYFNQGVLCG